MRKRSRINGRTVFSGAFAFAMLLVACATYIPAHASTVAWAADSRASQTRGARAETLATAPLQTPQVCTAASFVAQFQPQCAATMVGSAATQTGTPCLAQTMQCPLWSDTYDGPGKSADWGFAASTDSLGTRLFAGGTETDTSTSFPGVVIAYDMATGTRRWISKHAGTLQAMIVSSLQSRADGSVVYAAGDDYSGSYAPCGTDVFALDGATGAQLWDSPLPIGDGGCPLYVDSVLSPDGSRLYVISDIRDSSIQSGGQDVEQALTAAFDTATGQQLWVAHAPVTGYGYENWRLALSPDATAVFVASGTNSSSPLSPQTWTIWAYDATTGAQLWSTVYACAHNGAVFCSDPTGIAATSANVYVLGGNEVSEVLALSTQDGHQLWETDLDPQHVNFVYVLNHPIATAPDGDVFVGFYELSLQTVGVIQDNTAETFMASRLAASNGAVRWTQSMPANVTGDGSYCEGCGPILTVDSTGSHLYESGAYPAGDSLLTTESLDATSGVMQWSGLYLWSAGAAVDQLPEAITTPKQGGGVAIVGSANNAADTNPAVTCTICYDVATLVYASQAPAATTPDAPIVGLLPTAAGLAWVARSRARSRRAGRPLP